MFHSSITQQSTAECRVWHGGPPPHVGWWNASSVKNHTYWRWWDGKLWSRPATSGYSPENAALCAMKAEGPIHQRAIEWNDYWPEGARVPRVVPTGPYLGLIGASPAMPTKHPGWVDDLDNIVT